MKEYKTLKHEVVIPYTLRIFFGTNVFYPENPLLRDLFLEDRRDYRRKVMVYVDDGIPVSYHDQIRRYFGRHTGDLLLLGVNILPGGERIKNSDVYVRQVYEDINVNEICRHSYIIGIGGGAFLDVVGFAASTAHRGIRHIRLPSTTLAQADAGVGVKNGINYDGKKNFIGTFLPPTAVVNDFSLLDSLPEREIRNGYIEAIKVAAIKDAEFFKWIEDSVNELNAAKKDAIQYLIYRSAQLHFAHITTSGDPFERGSVRPLDFGHWAAHKLEQLSNYRISHGEAVAIGIALDTVYAERMGYLEPAKAKRVLALLDNLNFQIYTEIFTQKDERGNYRILDGLEEFREHLGGQLTITLLDDIGTKFDVHEVDFDQMLAAIAILGSR